MRDDTAVGVRDRSLTAEPILVPGTPFAKAVTDGEAEYAAAEETRGIAVRRFSLLDVVNEIVLGEPTPEADWPTENRRWHNGALRGENLGFVYLWMCGGDLGPHSIHFEAYLEDAPPKAVATTVALADPQPAVCGDQLCLYLSAIGSPGIARYNGTPDISHRSGHGIWRGAAAPAGLTIEMPDGTRRSTTFGVDFLVSTLSGAAGTLSRDQLLHSSPSVMYLDPDPLQIPDGSWRVFVGQDIGGDTGTLLRVDGSQNDGCRSWTEAFETSAPAALLVAQPVSWGSVPGHLRPIDQSKGLGALVGSDPDKEQDWPAPIDWSNAAVVGLHPHGKGPDEVTQSGAARTSSRHGRSARKATQAAGPTSGQVVSKGPSGGCGCGG